MIDAQLVRTRRRQLGLSQRAVGRSLGVTGLTITRLEEGANTAEFTLGQLHRLAEVLGVTPARLLATATSEPLNRCEDDDVARLGSLLAAADGPVTTSTLADALDLPLPRVETLLADLVVRLETVGMALQRDEDGVRVVTTLVDDEALQRLLHAQHAAHGLTVTDATVLWRALTRTLETRTLGNADRVALARLNNAGVLEGISPTADAAFALGVSDG